MTDYFINQSKNMFINYPAKLPETEIILKISLLLDYTDDSKRHTDKQFQSFLLHI